jgi:tetratricopeptide (TPR) repeat protein
MRLFIEYGLNIKWHKLTVLFTIFYSAIIFGQSEEPIMYHNYAIDMMAENIKFLATTEEYAENSTFQDFAKKLPKKLDRYNAKDYEAVLIYIAEEMVLTEETIEKYYSPFSFTKELSNVHHIATHALADIYMTRKKYRKAIVLYQNSMMDNPPKGTSGTTINKDFLRMELEISEAYFELKAYELAVLHLLHNVMNGQSFGNYLSTKLEEYEKFIDARTFIPKLEAMLLTLEKCKGYKLKYVFNGKTIQFAPFIANPESSRARVLNTEFYKNLKKKTGATQTINTRKPTKGIGEFEIDQNIFYHHRDINSFIKGLSILRKKEDFMDDKTFQISVDNCIIYLERGAFHEAIKELSYVMDNSFAIKDLFETLSENEKKEVENIQHFAAHYKMDILILEKEYAMAPSPLQYTRSVAGFDLKSDNKKILESDTVELLFKEATMYNGLAASEYGLLHLLGAYFNCPGYEPKINQLMLDTAKVLGKERVVKFLNQVEASLSKDYTSSLRLVSQPFDVKVQNFQKLKPKQIISRIHSCELYKTYLK